MVATPGCLHCVHVCLCVFLPMCFCQFCFPIVTSGFLWFKNPLDLGLCPIPLGPGILLALPGCPKKPAPLPPQLHLHSPQTLFTCPIVGAGVLACFDAHRQDWSHSGHCHVSRMHTGRGKLVPQVNIPSAALCCSSQSWGRAKVPLD